MDEQCESLSVSHGGSPLHGTVADFGNRVTGAKISGCPGRTLPEFDNIGCRQMSGRPNQQATNVASGYSHRIAFGALVRNGPHTFDVVTR
ncbi:hypothetical protein QZM22_29935 [Burkholderia oklahomensis]|nr:hypothetical protein [Burkholderia oklahomensis]